MDKVCISLKELFDNGIQYLEYDIAVFSDPH